MSDVCVCVCVCGFESKAVSKIIYTWLIFKQTLISKLTIYISIYSFFYINKGI
jgi:hypothetical protein